MNKLCSINKCYRNLSTISKIFNSRLPIVACTKNQLRMVSNESKSTPTTQQTNTNISKNELDKPQWERSDRYVS